MKKLLLLVVFSVACLAVRSAEKPASPGSAATAKATALKTYLIVLRLPARLHDDKAWTDADKAAVGAHFQRLKVATEAGQVILAGRTRESGEKTMGLVIFSAADDAAAREFMNGDPCVASGVMTATLHPYDLALIRRN